MTREIYINAMRNDVDIIFELTALNYRQIARVENTITGGLLSRTSVSVPLSRIPLDLIKAQFRKNTKLKKDRRLKRAKGKSERALITCKPAHAYVFPTRKGIRRGARRVSFHRPLKLKHRRRRRAS